MIVLYVNAGIFSGEFTTKDCVQVLWNTLIEYANELNHIDELHLLDVRSSGVQVTQAMIYNEKYKGKIEKIIITKLEDDILASSKSDPFSSETIRDTDPAILKESRQQQQVYTNYQYINYHFCIFGSGSTIQTIRKIDNKV